jgi:hypothetical protein
VQNSKAGKHSTSPSYVSYSNLLLVSTLKFNNNKFKKMKKSILAAMILVSSVAFAQDQPRTLLSKNKAGSRGYFVGASIQNGQMYNKSIWFSSLRVGTVLNNNWSIGGVYGRQLSNNNSPTTFIENPGMFEEFDLSYYAAFVEYRIKPHKLIHLAFPVNFGVFESGFEARYFAFEDYFDAVRFSLFVEPGVNLEINLHENVRIHVGVSYRLNFTDVYSEGINPPNTENQFLWNAGIKVGLFDIKNK